MKRVKYHTKNVQNVSSHDHKVIQGVSFHLIYNGVYGKPSIYMLILKGYEKRVYSMKVLSFKVQVNVDSRT